MVKWEYSMESYTFDFPVNVTDLWRKKQKDGSTEYKNIQKKGSEGWEVISITPIIAHAEAEYRFDEHGRKEHVVYPYTYQLLITYKRPIE